MTWRVLIAEDEPPARRQIVRLLQRHADLRLVATCASGDEALACARAQTPDILLLDIEMPGVNGFDVVRRLTAGRPPVVVFITAHDRFALEAFEVHALDYLLKPVDEARFDRALAWARAHAATAARGAHASALRALTAPALVTAEPAIRPATRLVFRHNGTLRFLPVAEITHITGESCYARVHTTARSYLVRDTLHALGQRLADPRFARIHRSTIVNLDHVRTLEPLTHGEARLVLSTGASVKTSRSHRHALQGLRPGPTRRGA